jgi:hypothetical protein
VPTSKRPQIDDIQYPRISNGILKGASHEEVVNDEVWQSDVNLERMECRDIQISCMAAKSLAESLEACQPLKVSSQKRPSIRRYLAGPLGAHPAGRPSFPT